MSLAINGRPSREQMLMLVAEVVAQRGTCSRAKVGAVFALEGRILVTGYNGAPTGLAHCMDDPGHEYIDRCTTAVHAEANAVAWAARHGIKLEGSDIFCTHAACLSCAQLLVNVGIRTATYMNSHPRALHDGLDLLQDAGVDVYRMS